jgi:hypothetical protein
VSEFVLSLRVAFFTFPTPAGETTMRSQAGVKSGGILLSDGILLGDG